MDWIFLKLVYKNADFFKNMFQKVITKKHSTKIINIVNFFNFKNMQGFPAFIFLKSMFSL